MAVIDSDLYTAAGRPWGDARYITPLLDDIARQAATADRTRSVADDVIASIKRNDIMRLSASPELGGLNETMLQIGCELREIAARCTSTGWCLWNPASQYDAALSVLPSLCAPVPATVTALARRPVNAAVPRTRP